MVPAQALVDVFLAQEGATHKMLVFFQTPGLMEGSDIPESGAPVTLPKFNIASEKLPSQ